MPIDKKDIPVTDRAVTMEKIIALCKNRGYIFPGSEIYGGLANTWDFGPLGVEFKNNIKDACGYPDEPSDMGSIRTCRRIQ